MSHSIELTRTVVQNTITSAYIINTGYIRTKPGLLKSAQLIIGTICLGVFVYYSTDLKIQPDLFFLLMSTSFLIGTFSLLVSCIFSVTTGDVISTTIYELVYHTVAAILLLTASVNLVLVAQTYNYGYFESLRTTWDVVAVLGFFNAILYFYSALLAKASYQGV